ncbi:hypothetical protein Syun_009544 [Stephania yunnanensis]|uniref:Uncharacterized protein n=1 Tax=Stephania yunnanensis TaxID=152371 RepID=A0AAP0KFR8_9MAGN
MARLDMDVLPEKTITDEIIERYRRMNGYQDIEGERERVEIARRKIEQRKKIRDDTRRILKEMSKTRNNLNVEQPIRDYDGLYMDELELGFIGVISHNQMTTLHNQKLVENMTDEEELCSAQPIFNPEEDVTVDMLRNFEVNEVTQVEDYLKETSEEREVFQIEPKIVIALNEGENDMKIDVISDKPEKPQIESEEDQPLVLVQPPTYPCTFGTPYKGVEVKERSQIFYNADTFMLDNPDAIDSFVLEVPNELLNLKEDAHASLSKYVDASFVVDISKG